MDAPGEKLVLRLWETLAEKGIGGLLSPWQTRRTGRARIEIQREGRLALAQAERDIKDIRAGRKQFTADYRLVEGSVPNDDTATRDDLATHVLAATAQRNLLREQMRAEVNVAKALLSAEADLESDAQEPPDGTVDDDWLFRWRDSASKVSSEKLQALWGRVFAGEIKSPGSFSLRTLEFLKNLSQREARWIEKLAPFVIDNDFVFGGKQELLDSEGIEFSFLVELQDLGIVTQAAPGMLKPLRSTVPNVFERVLVSYNRALVATHKDAKKRVDLEAYRLTSLGSQVLRLGSFTTHETYLRSAGEAIQHQGFKVSLGHYVRVTETEGNCYNLKEL